MPNLQSVHWFLRLGEGDGHTDAHTHRCTDNVKTVTPSADAGCNDALAEGVMMLSAFVIEEKRECLKATRGV